MSNAVDQRALASFGFQTLTSSQGGKGEPDCLVIKQLRLSTHYLLQVISLMPLLLQYCIGI